MYLHYIDEFPAIISHLRVSNKFHIKVFALVLNINYTIEGSCRTRVSWVVPIYASYAPTRIIALDRPLTTSDELLLLPIHNVIVSWISHIDFCRPSQFDVPGMQPPLPRFPPTCAQIIIYMFIVIGTQILCL